MQLRAPVCLVLWSACAMAAHDTAIDGNNQGIRTDAAKPTTDSGCVPATADLVMNGSFDSTPIGMGWASKPANAMYPIITSNGTVTAQSVPEKAWMGSVVGASDDMHEDVMIPATTTALVLTGFYEVRTVETGTTVFDTAKVELDDTSDALIEPALVLDNAHATTAWTPFTYTFTSKLAGKTVRLRFATKNNSTKPTSFFFDTVSLAATSCK